MEAYAAAMEPSFGYDQKSTRTASILSPFQPINTQVGRQPPLRVLSSSSGQSAQCIPIMPTPVDLAAVPVSTLQKETSMNRFRLLRPQLPADENEDLGPCPFCQGTIPTATLTETSFRCNVAGFLKNLRDKPHNICISLVNAGIELRIPFKIYAQSTIKRGRSSLRRHCLTFFITPQIVVHLFCRRPLTARGSIKWNDGTEPFVALEHKMMYTLRVMGQQVPHPLPHVVLSMDASAANLLQECGSISDMDDDPSSADTSGRAGSPMKTPKAIDNAERCLHPDLSMKGNAVRGYRIASYSFQMLMNAASKNLRQRACYFEIMLQRAGGTDDSVFEDCPRRLKWKVYADSTMKRGKKSMRRNDFVFPIDPGRYVVVFSKAPASSTERLALKWTEEKQEQFLAFESGLNFSIQVYSSLQGDQALIFRSRTGDDKDRIQNWRDDINPESEAGLQLRSKSSPQQTTAPWSMTPRIWNMSVNPGATFYSMITTTTGDLPVAPIVQVQLNPETIIQATVAQVDQRQRRSLLVKLPAVFSEEKVKQATSTGVSLVRQVQVTVLSEPAHQPLWQTKFTYEIGDNKVQPQN